jgi:serine beta-lactamase-like protein LACTB, mitochondrial
MAASLVRLPHPLRWILWLVVLTAMVSACPPVAVAQSAPPAVAATPTLLSSTAAAAVDAAIEQRMCEDGTVGLAVGIIRDGQIVYLKGYGQADRDAGVPVTTDTMFRWASISKPLTAIAALQLAEQEKLDLDADVRKYVPEFPDPGATITPRQLLCHQGGIVHYRNGEVVGAAQQYTDPFPYRDVVVALDTFCHSPLVNPPGEKYSYTTHGFMLLSAVVQRAGDQPFDEQVRERICRPLGMSTLQPDYQWVDIPRRTRGYRRVEQRIEGSIDDDVSWKLGGGGYISTIEDLCRFALGLIDGKLVSEQTEAAMWMAQATSGGEPTGYGLGFRVEEQDGTLKVSHNGSQHKTRTRMVIYPAQRHGVAVMTNSEWVDPGVYTTLTYKALAGARSPAPAQ